MLWACGGARACPGVCRCSLDGQGRRVVRCEGGALADPLPVGEMAKDTQVMGYIWHL